MGRLAWSVFVCLVLSALTLAGAAQERDRARIPDRYKWNLANIYPTDAAWRAAKEKLAADIPKMLRYQDGLLSSATTLSDGLDAASALDKELSRLFMYASKLADQDTRDSQHQGMRQEMVQLAATLRA
jgi:oligoendopeptidase F